MMTPQTVLGYVKAEPFCPFRLHLASDRTVDVRHPEMIKVLRSGILIFKVTGDAPDIPDEWDSVSLMPIESVSHLEAPVHEDDHGREPEAGTNFLFRQGVGICDQETR